MEVLRRYGKLLAPYTKTYVLGLTLLFVTNLLSLLVPRLTKGAVDALAHTHGIYEGDLPTYLGGWIGSPLSYVVALVIVGVVLAMIRATSRVVILGAGRELRRDLASRLYDKLLGADPAFYGRFATGEIMSRCTSDVHMMQAVASPGVLWSFNALFMFAIAIPYMFSVSVELTLYILAPFPFLALGTMWTVTRVKVYARQAQEAMAELTINLQETLAGMEVVKAFTLEEYQGRRFAESNDVYLEKSMREAVTAGAIGIAATLTGGIGTCVLLYYGGGMVARKELSYGDLALFISVMALVLRPTIFLGWVLSLAQRGLACLDRIDELLDAPLGIAAPEVVRSEGAVEGRIDVDGLTFRYPTHHEGAERRLALDDVSFSVSQGEVLGFVGRIGSGKSTALRALPRFVQAPEGSVKIDGVPVESWDLRELRRGIGYVPQDGAVFSLTLGANAAFGRPDATTEEIEAAVRAAALDKDLDQLEAGLETMIGERGVTLSGGQRQRLAIARAVLEKPRILILDDALSMVDAETAVAVLANLRESLKGTTLLVAAHRTATLLGCDEIVVLEKGVLVERGAPNDLLEREDSLFNAMHARQRLQTEIDEAQ